MRAGQKAFTQLHVLVFRGTRGLIGGRMFLVENVLLTTTGRKSGKQRVTPLTATLDGDRVVLVASNGGAPKHPDWYLNLQADPHVTVQRGGSALAMLARTASAEERAELWPRVVATFKGYDGYQKRTEREIPLVICEPA
jgi:deazaflavin-dependent oxidoreductase (nitroreductase family)